jgi:hypothetical protein
MKENMICRKRKEALEEDGHGNMFKSILNSWEVLFLLILRILKCVSQGFQSLGKRNWWLKTCYMDFKMWIMHEIELENEEKSKGEEFLDMLVWFCDKLNVRILWNISKYNLTQKYEEIIHGVGTYLVET